MDRKWMAAAAVSAAFWTFALLSAPLAAFCFPGRAEGVHSAGAVSPAPESTPAAGTSSAPTPPPPEDASPVPTQAPSPAAEDGQLRSFTDESPARVRNFTSYDVDLEALEAEPLPQRLPSEGPQILILHTHGTEAYLPVSGEEYQASDPYRTTDAAHSVIRVGDVLCAALEAQGLTVIHDRGLYDYPSYTGSYARSQEAAEGWLARYPGIGIVIDLHRDAVGADQVIYKTLTRAAGESAAQAMLVIGTGENGLEHPRWRDNLALALAMQRAAEQEVPSLLRPIRLVKERYNQHLSTGAFILEVGANGNTLSEAERAAELFARAVGPLFLSLVEAD